jgi:hypothetical protein
MYLSRRCVEGDFTLFVALATGDGRHASLFSHGVDPDRPLFARS